MIVGKEKCCGCIIIEDNKVLVVQQKAGHWGFPKGHVEGDETEEETAIREIKEELNIEVEIDKSKRYVTEYEKEKGTLKQVVLFIAKRSGGETKIQESEIMNVKWLPFQEALETITYESVKKLFQQVLEEMKIKDR